MFFSESFQESIQHQIKSDVLSLKIQPTKSKPTQQKKTDQRNVQKYNLGALNLISDQTWQNGFLCAYVL